jgi:ferredoxin--NADP+ reductase
MRGTFVTGWIKRGPIGLIGHTKSDAAETVGHLLAETRPTAGQRDPEAVNRHLTARGIDFTTFEHWQRLDAHEIAMGRTSDRERVKLSTRKEMLDARR